MLSQRFSRVGGSTYLHYHDMTTDHPFTLCGLRITSYVDGGSQVCFTCDQLRQEDWIVEYELHDDPFLDRLFIGPNATFNIQQVDHDVFVFDLVAVGDHKLDQPIPLGDYDYGLHGGASPLQGYIWGEHRLVNPTIQLERALNRVLIDHPELEQYLPEEED